LQPGQETTVELERGKTLVVRLQTVGEPDDEGQVRVFFELNGQPRMIRVPNRSVAATVIARRKAEEGEPGQLAAPMPGAVSSIAVAVGQRVEKGDVVLTLEAMKMETVLHATLAGAVKEILVSPGTHVDAKDLLVVIE
jgi:pyruvate carboxylase